jgi:hypothetical protein
MVKDAMHTWGAQGYGTIPDCFLIYSHHHWSSLIKLSICFYRGINQQKSKGKYRYEATLGEDSALVVLEVHFLAVVRCVLNDCLGQLRKALLQQCFFIMFIPSLTRHLYQRIPTSNKRGLYVEVVRNDGDIGSVATSLHYRLVCFSRWGDGDWPGAPPHVPPINLVRTKPTEGAFGNHNSIDNKSIE